MTTEEIRSRFAPRKCNSQVEFDQVFHDINNQQSKENHPYDDRLRELDQRKAFLENQRSNIHAQLQAIKAERIGIEQRKKDINRVFYQLKNDMIALNPNGLKNEPGQ